MKPWYLYISNVHVYIKISQHLGGGGDWSLGGEIPGHPPLNETLRYSVCNIIWRDKILCDLHFDSHNLHK